MYNYIRINRLLINKHGWRKKKKTDKTDVLNKTATRHYNQLYTRINDDGWIQIIFSNLHSAVIIIILLI